MKTLKETAIFDFIVLFYLYSSKLNTQPTWSRYADPEDVSWNKKQNVGNDEHHTNSTATCRESLKTTKDVKRLPQSRIQTDKK